MKGMFKFVSGPHNKSKGAMQTLKDMGKMMKNTNYKVKLTPKKNKRGKTDIQLGA